MKKISLAIAAIILFNISNTSTYASSFTNNTNDLWLHRAQGQPQSCPKTISPKQVVDLGTSNYYCGYDICSSKDFDENDGCLEKVGSSTGQGGFATYLSLHPQAQSATDFCMIDNNIPFNCNIAKTESGFSMSDLSFKSITQTDKNKNIVTLGPIKNYKQIPWRGVNISGLEKLNKKFHKRIIFPIHPRTLNKLKHFKIPKCIETSKPLGFFDFTHLEKHAFCLITDSGTVPEESFYFKKPCVSIRESTERPEYLETGSTIISGLDPRDIVQSVSLITSHTSDWEWDKSLGDGNTASKVVNIMRGKSRKILEI